MAQIVIPKAMLRLNVGGKVFEVPQNRITGSDSMLATMLSSEIPASTLDSGGALCIDRSPDTFSFVQQIKIASS